MLVRIGSRGSRLALTQAAAAAERVRRGIRSRQQIPDFSGRSDEIGHLSGALRDMTQALGMAPGLASLVMYIGSTDTAIISAGAPVVTRARATSS